MSNHNRVSPDGRNSAKVLISYTSILHECLRYLLDSCSGEQGECAGCPIHNECLEWWTTVSTVRGNNINNHITTENFPLLVLQFENLRSKARTKAQEQLRVNQRMYYKELQYASV